MNFEEIKKEFELQKKKVSELRGFLWFWSGKKCVVRPWKWNAKRKFLEW